MVTTITTIKSSFSLDLCWIERGKWALWSCVPEALNFITSGGRRELTRPFHSQRSTLRARLWCSDNQLFQKVAPQEGILYDLMVLTEKKKSFPLCEKGIACKTRFPEVLRWSSVWWNPSSWAWCGCSVLWLTRVMLMLTCWDMFGQNCCSCNCCNWKRKGGRSME